MKRGKIGIFDSGFGGLTITKVIREAMPKYDYIYFGDNARAPYGSRSRERIYEFTREAVDFLLSEGCEVIVLACNTASAEALRKIQQEHLPVQAPGKRVLGVIVPTLEEVIKSGAKEICVLATEGTVCSKTYVVEMEKIDPKIKVRQIACPLLVPIIETGNINPNILREALKEYLTGAGSPDSVILGCTHYSLIKEEIANFFKESTIINQAEILPKKFSDYLKRHAEIEARLSKTGSLTIYTTDLTTRFKDFSNKVLGKDLPTEQIDLG